MKSKEYISLFAMFFDVVRCPFICPSACPSIRQFLCNPVVLSVRSLVRPSVRPSVCSFARLSFVPPVLLSAIRQTFLLPVCPLIQSLLRSYVCLSVHPSELPSAQPFAQAVCPQVYSSLPASVSPSERQPFHRY